MRNRGNLKLVRAQPTPEQLQAAIDAAEETLRRADVALVAAQQKAPSIITAENFNGPERADYAAKHRAREKAYAELMAARDAVVAHHLRQRREVGEKERRAALVEAIKQAHRTAKRLDAHRETLARANQLIDEHESGLNAAKASVQRELDRFAKQTERSLASRSRANGSELRKARERETEAVDHLEAAHKAAENLEDKTPGLEQEHRKAEEDAAKAANYLLALQAGIVLDRARSLQAELGAVRAILSFLKTGKRLDDVDQKAVNEFFLVPFPHEPNVRNTNPAPHPILTEWEAFAYAVRVDPDTPLPKVP
jgi:hypothetical protein